MGILIGFIYLSSVIGRLQIRLTPFTCGFTIATIFSLTQAKVSYELCCVSLTLVYALIALNLSSSNWLFSVSESKNTELYAENGTTHLIVKQMRPLIYLAGAKLLTVFCYFAPFVCIASQILVQPNVSFADVNNTSTDDEIFNDLIVLFLTRLALGTITILLERHNVNYLTIIYIMPVTMLLAIILLIPLLDLRRLITECTFVFCIMMTTYVAISLFVDIISHRVVLSTKLDLDSVKVISLTFATFIEHLIDVLFVVIYLSDWISAELIITSLSIVTLTLLFHKYTQTVNTNRILKKSQIL